MCKITMNNSILLIFVFLILVTSSLIVTHGLFPSVVEGQTVNNTNNFSDNKNSLNVIDLINSNISKC